MDTEGGLSSRSLGSSDCRLAGFTTLGGSSDLAGFTTLGTPVIQKGGDMPNLGIPGAQSSGYRDPSFFRSCPPPGFEKSKETEGAVGGDISLQSLVRRMEDMEREMRDKDRQIGELHNRSQNMASMNRDLLEKLYIAGKETDMLKAQEDRGSKARPVEENQRKVNGVGRGRLFQDSECFRDVEAKTRYAQVDRNPHPQGSARVVDFLEERQQPKTASYGNKKDDYSFKNSTHGNIQQSAENSANENYGERRKEGCRYWEDRNERSSGSDVAPRTGRGTSTGEDWVRKVEKIHLTLPYYDGKEEWETFIVPFERIVRRQGWKEDEALDQLITHLKGNAQRFLCLLPAEIRDDYKLVLSEMYKRFSRREPPSTARKKLMHMQQEMSVSNEVFADEVQRLVHMAYPEASRTMLEEVAVETFLSGYKNAGEISFHVMNSCPKTLAEAVERVEAAEHNYQIAIGKKPKGARRVSFSDDEEERLTARVQQVKAEVAEITKTGKLETMMEQMLKILQRINDDRKQSPERGRERDRRQRPTSPRRESPRRLASPEGRKRGACFTCNETGHWSQECPKRTGSPDKRKTVVCWTCGETGHWSNECSKKGNFHGTPPPTGSRSNKL